MDRFKRMTLCAFSVTIIAIILNRISSTVTAVIGVVAMIWIGSMGEVEAVLLID